ncbi:MAG: hypothetical protein JKX73_06485, partial [Flavobacteriales bacterium]|nr:hypothetical protein [Flavobacteriales bacterium]
MKYQILKSKSVLVILLVFNLFLFGCAPPPVNLAWSEDEAFWVPVSVDTIIVEGLGISDTVYVLDKPYLTCITKTIKNTSLVDLSKEQSYKTHIIVQPYEMQFIDGQVLFSPNGDPVYDELFSGLAVASGDTVQFSACPGLHLECGFYKVSVVIDPGEKLNETSKSDNVFSDFINIPGAHQVNLAL